MRNSHDLKQNLKNSQKRFLTKKNEPDALLLYIQRVFKEYANALSSPLEDKEEIHPIIEKYLIFENLELDNLSFEAIRNKLDNYFSNLRETLDNQHYRSVSLYFKNCAIKRLYIISGQDYNHINTVIFENSTKIENILVNATSNKQRYSNFIFRKLKIQNVIFKNDRQQEIRDNFSFFNCNFENNIKEEGSPIIFGKLLFEDCIFYKAPKFNNIKFSYDTSFQHSKFLDVHTPDTIGDYRSLKQKMHEKGNEHDAMIFHGAENEARHNIILKGNKKYLIDRFASWFLKGFNDYGRNTWHPLICLILFTFIVTCIYYIFDSYGYGAVVCGQNLEKEIWLTKICEEKNSVWLSFILSIKNSFGPLSVIFDSGVLQPKNGWFVALEKFQIIVSTISWFIWILQIRRQFKL